MATEAQIHASFFKTLSIYYYFLLLNSVAKIQNEPNGMLFKPKTNPICSCPALTLVSAAALWNINNIIFSLAQSFLRPQGLGSAESGYVLSYIEHFGLCRIRRDREKESPKYKTKPKQTQFKAKQSQFFGGFWRKNFNFSLKIDDTKLNLLCKTKPIYKNLTLSMSFQKTLNMQNEPNLYNILTWLTKEMKRTYSDFYQKVVKKTNPILTKS